jgi:hypothetical protein
VVQVPPRSNPCPALAAGIERSSTIQGEHDLSKTPPIFASVLAVLVATVSESVASAQTAPQQTAPPVAQAPAQPQYSAPAPAPQPPQYPAPAVQRPTETQATPPPERFGQGPQLALSAESLFGYSHDWATREFNNVSGNSVREVSIEADTVAFLGVGDNGDDLQPGLGFDVVFEGGVTLGGSLFYAAGGGTQTSTAGTTTTTETTEDLDDTSSFGVSARVGYAAMATDVVGMWPRVGIGYRTSSDTSYDYSNSSTSPPEEESTMSLFGAVVGADVVISPAAHFALLVGLKSLLGFAGSFENKAGGTTALDGDIAVYNVAVDAGLMGYL